MVIEIEKLQRTEVSRQQTAEKNAISGALSGCLPATQSTGSIIKHHRCWAFARHLGVRIVD
jgi:hypothetical protein